MLYAQLLYFRSNEDIKGTKGRSIRRNQKSTSSAPQAEVEEVGPV